MRRQDDGASNRILERRLLYVVAILAPIVEGMMFFQLHQPDLPTRMQLINQLNSCEAQLVHAFGQCTARKRSSHGV